MEQIHREQGNQWKICAAVKPSQLHRSQHHEGIGGSWSVKVEQQNWVWESCCCSVYKTINKFDSFSFVFLSGTSEETTFNCVGIKLLYSCSRAWEENSLLSAVRPTCTSLAFFFFSLSTILFLVLNKLMDFIENCCSRGRDSFSSFVFGTLCFFFFFFFFLQDC